MNTGQDFEKAVEVLFKVLYQQYHNVTLHRNVFIEGLYGKRQIDVLLKIAISDLELLIVVECKDLNSKLSVGVIDAFHSKLQDIKASKGIIVAKKGFSSQAMSKAEKLGMQLYTFDKFIHEKHFDLSIPILKRVETLHGVGYEFDFQNVDIDDEVYLSNVKKNTLHINGEPIYQNLAESWMSLDFIEHDQMVPDDRKVYDWDIPKLVPPFEISVLSGNKRYIFPLQFFRIRITYYTQFFIGALHELFDFDVVENLNKGETNFLINLTKLKKDYHKKFIRVKNENFLKNYRGYCYRMRVAEMDEQPLTIDEWHKKYPVSDIKIPLDWASKNNSSE